MLRKASIACGILSSLLFGAMITFITYDGYSRISQTPSELTAFGAPTRELWAVLAPIYNILILIFSVGVWMSWQGKRLVRVIAALLFVIGLYVFLWPFATMHQRDVLESGGGTFSDTLHIILGTSEPLIMLVIVGLGMALFGKPFRLFSLAMFLLMIVSGVFVGIDSPKLSTGEPTPYIGLWERLTIAGFLLWVIVFSARLLREPIGSAEDVQPTKA